MARYQFVQRPQRRNLRHNHSYHRLKRLNTLQSRGKEGRVRHLQILSWDMKRPQSSLIHRSRILTHFLQVSTVHWLSLVVSLEDTSSNIRTCRSSKFKSKARKLLAIQRVPLYINIFSGFITNAIKVRKITSKQSETRVQGRSICN